MPHAKEIFDALPMQMRLHRERISVGGATYRLETIGDREVLDALFTCYRATRTRVECRMERPFIHPMTVGEVRRRLDEFEPDNRAAFLSYAESYEALEDGIEMLVPAYGLGSAGYLLLDGNHRATAAAIANQPFTLTMAVLDGPIDRKILRDLRFWDGGLMRFAKRFGIGEQAR